MSSTIFRRLIGVIAALALVVGISAATVTPAEAKRGVWDKVAKCESGGRWHINTGNGYYGGLQFSGSTWRAYGGKRYARQAHKASRAEQIAIARRVLAGQGPGAWPTCSRKAGLTRSNGKASRKATPSSNSGSSTVGSKYSGSEKKSKKSDKAKKSSSSSKKKMVRVKKGDTLSKIAARYDVKGGWKRVYKLNKSKLSSPNKIKVGQKLRIR